MAADAQSADLLTSLLKDVSRSFYLTLRVLPGAIRNQIGLAYLLARATDTIADTEIVSLPVRLEKLAALRDRIDGKNVTVDLGALADQQGSSKERELLKRINEALTLLDHSASNDRALIQAVLGTITSGQELDLRRFATASATNIIPLAEDAELDDYTYRVAGCVGEFWTRMCISHLPIPASVNQPQLIQDGIRFGKGLQLVNILRDLPTDLRNGRCYIPRTLLDGASLSPTDLLSAENINRFRSLYDSLVNRAEDHLYAGWEYTNTLPFRWARVRLACAWPILIGLRTTAHLRAGNPLDASHRIKVSRKEVKSLIARSMIGYPFSAAPYAFSRPWNRLVGIASHVPHIDRAPASP